jgi:hypothetical protein
MHTPAAQQGGDGVDFFVVVDQVIALLRQRPRDPVSEFLLVGRYATACRSLVVFNMFRIVNIFAGHPTRRDALWRII